jgi:hypothetical protein
MTGIMANNNGAGDTQHEGDKHIEGLLTEVNPINHIIIFDPTLGNKPLEHTV